MRKQLLMIPLFNRLDVSIETMRKIQFYWKTARAYELIKWAPQAGLPKAAISIPKRRRFSAPPTAVPVSVAGDISQPASAFPAQTPTGVLTHD